MTGRHLRLAAGGIAAALVLSDAPGFLSRLLLNAGALLLARSETQDLPPDRRSRDVLRAAERLGGSASSSESLHLWVADAEQGRCDAARASAGRILQHSDGVGRLADRVYGDLVAQLCLLDELDRRGDAAQASVLRRFLRFPPAHVFETSSYRRAALLAAPELLRRRIWSVAFARRVLGYAAGTLIDLDSVRHASEAISALTPESDELREFSAALVGIQPPAPFPECESRSDPPKVMVAGADQPAWRDTLDRGFTRWNLNTGWIGGENFRSALFLWQHDRLHRQQGEASLHLTGMWVEPDESLESPRVAASLSVPVATSRVVELRLFYRTQGLTEGEALIRLTRADRIAAQWPLGPTDGCWQAFEQTVDWASGPAVLMVILAAEGDLWVDNVSASTPGAK